MRHVVGKCTSTWMIQRKILGLSKAGYGWRSRFIPACRIERRARCFGIQVDLASESSPSGGTQTLCSQTFLLVRTAPSIKMTIRWFHYTVQPLSTSLVTISDSILRVLSIQTTVRFRILLLRYSREIERNTFLCFFTMVETFGLKLYSALRKHWPLCCETGKGNLFYKIAKFFVLWSLTDLT